MSSGSEDSACKDDVVDIGSEDSAEDLNSEDDYYIDEETGEHVRGEDIMKNDKEAFSMLHELLYGPRYGSRDDAFKTWGSKSKRTCHDSESDTGSESDEKPKRKRKRAASPHDKKKEKKTEKRPMKKARGKDSK